MRCFHLGSHGGAIKGAHEALLQSAGRDEAGGWERQRLHSHSHLLASEIELQLIHLHLKVPGILETCALHV